MPDWRAVARSIAEKAGVPPDLFDRQISQESGYRVDAVSPAGARGIAQIVSEYHPNVDPMDPVASLTYAAKWMRELYGQYGNWRDALLAYNGGGRAVERWKAGRPFEESVAYINAILGPGKAEAAELDQPAPTTKPSTPTPAAKTGGSPVPDDHGALLPGSPRTYWTVLDPKTGKQQVVDSPPADGSTGILGTGIGGKANSAAVQWQEERYEDGTVVVSSWNTEKNSWEPKSVTVDGPMAARWRREHPTQAPQRPTNVPAPPSQPNIVTRNPDGSVTTQPNPNYVAPKPPGPTTVNTSANEPYIVTRAADGSLTKEDNPNYVPPKPAKPGRHTYSFGGRIVTTDDDGNVVNIVDVRTPGAVAKEGQDLEAGALGIEKDKIAIEASRRALLPKAQQVIAGHLQTVEYVRGMLERGEIDQAKADAYVAASKAQAEAELGGTTTWAMKKAEDDAKQARERMGVDLLNQRISSESSLGSSVVSSALGLAAKAMLRPGQTSLGVDPFAAAAGYSAQINRGAQTDPVVAALLGGASAAPTAAPGPGLPPGAPAFPPPTGGAGGPSMPGALR